MANNPKSQWATSRPLALLSVFLSLPFSHANPNPAPMPMPFGTVNSPILLNQHNEHEMITRLSFQCPLPAGASPSPSDTDDSASSTDLRRFPTDGTCFEPLSLSQLAGTHVGKIIGLGENGAVGAPDLGIPEGPEAHCDDADYMDIPGYPVSRSDATAQLQKCIDHLRIRFVQSYQATDRIISDAGNIDPEMVKIGDDCAFTHEEEGVRTTGRAKCNVLEGFGRALHGLQDFYAHSNWADIPAPSRDVNITNPPGHDFGFSAPFMDLRAENEIGAQVPVNLSTGCFSLNPFGGCEDRITHDTMNKDHGIIHLDGTFGEVGQGTPRGEIEGNFKRAVDASVQDSKDLWGRLRTQIRSEFGGDRGNLMICGLVRDDPAKHCLEKGRKVVVVVDGPVSGDGDEKVEMAKEIAGRMVRQGDEVAVVASSSGTISAMGGSGNVGFDGLDSTGAKDVGAGLQKGLEVVEAARGGDGEVPAAIVVVTDSPNEKVDEQTSKLSDAADKNVRVSYVVTSGDAELPDSVIEGVDKTGGVVTTVSGDAEQNAADIVFANGLTPLDAPPAEPLLIPGGKAKVAGLTSRTLVYPATTGETVRFSLSGSQGLKGVIHDVKKNEDVAEVETDGEGGKVAEYNVPEGTDVEFLVSTTGDDSKKIFKVETGSEGRDETIDVEEEKEDDENAAVGGRAKDLAMYVAAGVAVVGYVVM